MAAALNVSPPAALAAVSTGTGSASVERLDRGTATGWLRVESSGICGTDVQLHHGVLRAPAVLGHHVIGTIEELEPGVAASLGVRAGDRVAVEEYLGCGTCPECSAGAYRFCPHADLWTGGERVGMLPVNVRTGLHGGNAEYMELSRRHAMHVLPDSLSFDAAAWTLPLANALEWVSVIGGARAGSRVAVIGPGYHGVACVVAARHVGARDIHLIGLERDADRLQLSEGLDVFTHIGEEVARVGEVDVVIDTVGTERTMRSATQMLARHGTLVLAGIAADARPGFDPASIIRRLLSVRGVRGRTPESVRRSISALTEGIPGLATIPTHRVGLNDVGSVLHDMKTNQGPTTPHVVVDPWLPRTERLHNERLQEVTS